MGNPAEHVRRTEGLTTQDVEGDSHRMKNAQKLNETKAKMRSGEVNMSVKPGEMQWSDYGTDIGAERPKTRRSSGN